MFEQEVDDFCAVYYLPKQKESVHNHSKMDGILNPAVERFKALSEEDDQNAFKKLVISFKNLYGFLS